MTRAFLFISLWFCTHTLCAQKEDIQQLLDSAKTIFKTAESHDVYTLGDFDYLPVIYLLEKVVALDSTNAEARYFLANGYSRFNSAGGETMIEVETDLTKMTSHQLEEVIRLTPKYEGEMLVLNPYCKISSEWGTLAMKYLYHNQPDSALWAFEEGKKRGGFSNYMLEYNKLVLDVCTPNAILMSSGDMNTTVFWYLQKKEGYRKDVNVVDIDLLNTIWYPKYIEREGALKFGLPPEVLDTLQYIAWKEKKVKVDNISWSLKPTTYDAYLIRNDILFLKMLQENRLHKDVFFVVGFPEQCRLNLEKFFTFFMVADKLTMRKKLKGNYTYTIEKLIKLMNLAQYLNLNDPTEVHHFEYFRSMAIDYVRHFDKERNTKEAMEVLSLLVNNPNITALPFEYPEYEAVYLELRKKYKM